MAHSELNEQAIAELVQRFYRRAASDADLKPIFDAVIDDWDAHHRIVSNFWSRVLLKTPDYQGSPYPLHARLPIEIEHFDIWLGYFRETAREVLTADAATQAIAHAEHMAESFKLGMFPEYQPLR
ncbi:MULTISPECIES: group III truncated hemoglobin [Methylomonas]|uniref:group III truncated hemoglobin n=1 Tax=Methylomonas TaxID=416 RepID=UPI001232CA84|nr:group III truncated hemoglobin [Methylomonas rhizoryzae]